MMRGLGILFAACCIWGCSQTPEPYAVPDDVLDKLEAQEAAWNAGDIDAFMDEAYWKDDRLVFVGSKGPTYGYEATLANYHKSYDSPEAMGQLEFDVIEWRGLGNSYGFMLGKWGLKRGGELPDLAGHFTLIWQNLPGEGWVIIADHSS